MLRAFLAAFLCFFTAVPAIAQDESRAILVLDASGSMWGQIDGIAKITIAQQVVGDLLDTLPPSQLLGLTAYGHRRKGDCSDIETLHLPGTDRATIAATVNALSPRGKTPLSAAVLQAAVALKYTEEAATVILISDGIETCSLDPCEVGRQLEQTGVDFTAHVIGFDVTDPVAQAQLQCLAHETGGIYLPADNADELAEALQEMAEAPAQVPSVVEVPVTVTFRATEGQGGPVIEADLVWTMATDTTGILYENEFASQISHELMAGTGEVNVLRVTDEASASAEFTVASSTLVDGNMVVTLVLPKLVPKAALLATLDAAEAAPAGSEIMVTWTGPNHERDFITVTKIGARNSEYGSYSYTKEGSPAPITLPLEVGQYELRYVSGQENTILGHRVIDVGPISATLAAPDSATIGSEISVDWSGPAYPRDYISISEIGTGITTYISYSYTREGTTLSLQAPTTPGEYELRYVAYGSPSMVLARKPIRIDAALARLDASAFAPAGSTLVVAWEGPGHERDHITIAKPGQPASGYESYTYISEGSPLTLRMPSEPGEYELRYILDGAEDVILARTSITIEDVTARIKAPDTAPAGSKLILNWQGPGEDRDFITIAKPTDAPNTYQAFAYVRDGSPLTLQMPSEPGEYELRYVLKGTETTILVRSQITITAVSATLDAPDSALVGSEVIINWTGPEGEKDHLTIAVPEANPGNYEAFVYVRDGNPLRLRMPTTPGTYELRYVARGTERDILVRKAITVLQTSATLDAPTHAPAGSTLVVNWTGPMNERDHLTIAQPGANAGNYETFTYIREGNPLSLQVPTHPGTYELRYIIQGTDRGVLERQSLVVEPVTATLEAEAKVAAGGNLVIAWIGPDYRNDYIAISRVDDLTGYEVFTYTKNGSPLVVKAPDAPGTYEVRYVINRDRVTIARQILVVE